MGRPQPSFKTLKHISICSTLPPAPMQRKESVRDLKTRKKENSGRQDSFSMSSKRTMAYLVSITSRAERDLAQLFTQINAENSSAALKWYLGLKEAILSLEERPSRCPVIRRKDKLRHLLYGHKPHIYRVIYRVVENQKRVEVLHI